MDTVQELEEFFEKARDLLEDVPPTKENLHAAAVGLVSQWYRNTEAVEDLSHASGPWSDPDMLRHNSHATAWCLDALEKVAAVITLEAYFDEDYTTEFIEEILTDLFETLRWMLPSEAASNLLYEEKGGGPYMAALFISYNGFGNWLAFLTMGATRPTFSVIYPSDWWGVPGFDSIVDQFCSLSPPDPDTFRERMLNEPWSLTDEQASFVCDHRYDVRNPVLMARAKSESEE